jgi:prevent-host-death family protein
MTSRESRSIAECVSVAEAKRRFSELLGRVAFGGETIVIARRGRPMARLSPAVEPGAEEGLAAVKGFLDEDDPLFARLADVMGGDAPPLPTPPTPPAPRRRAR